VRLSSAEATTLVTLRFPGCEALVGVTGPGAKQNPHLTLKQPQFCSTKRALSNWGFQIFEEWVEEVVQSTRVP
jgi:hypothetical protein